MADRPRETARPVPEPMSAAAAVREVAAHALEAVVTMDAAGLLTGWNSHAEELFGWNASDVIGKPMEQVIVPERYRAAHLAGLTRYRLTGRGRLLDTRTKITALHHDGHEVEVEISITALAEAEGVTFVGFLRDLTAEHQLEEALRAVEARYAGVISHLPGVVYVDRLGGGGLYVSPKVDEILGYSVEEWLANDGLWTQLLHPDDRERALSQLRHGEASGGSFAYIYRLNARDGRVVWIRDQATVHREANGELIVSGVMFDITRERGVETELELAISERADIAASLRRLPPGRPASETAAAICRELQRLPHLDIAVVYEFAHDGSVVPIAELAPPGAPIAAGHPLPASRAAYLSESATGPWIDEWRPQADDDAYRRAWLDLGLTCGAFVPFGADGVTYGLLSAGTTAPIGSAGVSRWLPSLTEFGTIAAALLGPELSARRQQDGTRAELQRIVAEDEMAPVFQPVVRLGDGSVVGYEALTRFSDGTPPDRRFALAEAVDAGAELERAAIQVALRSASRLPRGRWVSVNLSPSRLIEPGIIDMLLGMRGRPIVVEVTERLPIDDYDAVRAALNELAGSIEVAVDDAGAGFASLRHILELRPRYVKLDMQLVRGVDTDPARQALIAGMVYFARQSGCLLIGEGVESEQERATLRRLGVPFGQGFHWGHPAPAEAIAHAERAARERSRRRRLLPASAALRG
ncbi:MAG: EAL domain-containing protein [Candidatus Limnocylindria bacterium]